MKLNMLIFYNMDKSKDDARRKFLVTKGHEPYTPIYNTHIYGIHKNNIEGRSCETPS